MSDTYSNIIDQAFGTDARAQARMQAFTSIDSDPEKARRAMELTKGTEIPPSVAFDDIDSFEVQRKGAMASELINNSPYLQSYINSHPLAAHVSNDDYGQLDTISAALKKLPLVGPLAAVGAGALGKAASGFKEGFGSEPSGAWAETPSASDKEFEANYPLAYEFLKQGAVALGEPLELMGRAFSGGVKALQAGTEELGVQMGMDPSEAKRLSRDLAGMAEYQLQQTPGKGMGVPKFGEAISAAAPYLRAGHEPPAGLHPVIDQFKQKQLDIDLKNLDEIQREVAKSTTRERSPELAEGFLRQQLGDAKIGISADAVAELYKDKQPHAEDGLLGWAPELEKQMAAALATGGDVEIPLATWLARVEPEVAKELHDFLRVRKGGLTKAEGEVLKQSFMIEAYHGSPHVFERFDLSKIGSGEGAQSYGHGLYFAENAAVAKLYARTTSERDFIRKARELYDEFDSPSDAHAAIAESKEFTPGQKRLLLALEKDDWLGFDYPHQALSAALRDAKSFDLSPETLAAIHEVGNQYQVRIKADREHMLDWDKPLSEQPEKVRAAIAALSKNKEFRQRLESLGEDPKMEAVYGALGRALGKGAVGKQADALASRALNEAGIPGIRYLDHGSRPTARDLKVTEAKGPDGEDLFAIRGTPDGVDYFRTKAEAEARLLELQPATHNFVVFDDSLIEITHKNDQAVASVRKAAGLDPLFERQLGEAEQAAREGEWVPVGKTIEAFVPEKFTAFEEAIAGVVDSELAKIVPKKVETEFAADLRRKGDKGQAGGVYSQFNNRLPLITLALANEIDVPGVARHEAIHHLRAYGFFSETEWATLKKAAEEEGWVKKERGGKGSSIERRYQGKLESADLFLEEAIADEFRYWNRNPDSPTLAAAIFEKLRDFLQKVKAKFDALMSKNPDVAEIFRMVESGEIGSREGTMPRHPKAFDQKLSEKEPELPGVTRQEDLSTFEPKAVGLTKKHMQKVMDLIAKLNEEDAAWQQAKLEKIERAKQTKEWKEEAVGVRDEVENDISSRPDIALSDFLRAGRLYGEETGKRPRIDPKQLTPEQRALFPAKYQRRDGMAPGDVANLFGYPSIDAMAEAMAKLEADMGTQRPGDYVHKLVSAETERRMVEKHGDLDENIIREAQEHVVSPTQMDLLHEETVAIGMENGWEMPFTKEDVKAGTRQAFGDMRASDVDMETFLRDSGKAGKLAQLALLEKNPTEFFKQRQRQEFALRYADEAKRFVKEQTQFERTAKRFSNREVAGILPEYTNFVHDILLRVSQPVKRSLQDLAEAIDRSGFKDIESFVSSKEADLREVPVADFLLDPNFRKSLNDMSVAEYRAVADSIKALVHNGRNELRIIRQGEAFDLQAVRDGMREQLETFPEKHPDVTQPAGKGFKYVAKTAWAALLQIEALFNRWDRGDRNGLFTKYISLPLADASNNFASLERKYGAKIRELKDDIDLNAPVANTIFREPTAGGYGDLLQFNRGNLRAALRYVGRPQALEKLAAGYGLKPEQVMQWLHQNAKKEDWDWAAKQGKIFDEVFEEASRMYERLTGVAPEKANLAPVDTPFGTYEGWYHPISYDPRFPGQSKKLMGGDALEQNNYIRATTPAGYTKKVTGYNAPLNLDLANTAEHLRGMLHDIAYREAVVEASKIFYDSSFQRTVNKHYGQQYQKLLIPYLRDVANLANFKSEAQAIGARVSEFLRQNIIGTLIGFNPGTVMKHGATAWVNSMNEVGSGRFLSAVKDMFQKDEVTGERNWSFALQHSEELQRRHRNYIETLRGSETEALGETSWRETMLRGGAWTVSKADLASAVPTWLAEYKHSMEEGRSHGEAVSDGNRAVRRAHGSSVVTNRPAAMRGGQAAQWMTSLYGFFSHMLNKQFEMMWRAREMTGKFSEGEYKAAAKDLPQLTSMFFSYVIFPALIEELVTPLTNDEHESWAAWSGKTLAKGVSSSWPIVRDLAHAALSMHSTEPSVGLFTSSLKTAIDVTRDMKDVPHKLDREHAGKTLQHGITAFGALTGLANQQEGRVARFMYNMYTGQERPKGPWQLGVGLRFGQTKGHSTSFDDYMKSLIGKRQLVGGR